MRGDLFQAHTQGGSSGGSGWGVSRPTPKGEIEGIWSSTRPEGEVEGDLVQVHTPYPWTPTTSPSPGSPPHPTPHTPGPPPPHTPTPWTPTTPTPSTCRSPTTPPPSTPHPLDPHHPLAEFCVHFWSLFHGQDHLVLSNSIR